MIAPNDDENDASALAAVGRHMDGRLETLTRTARELAVEYSNLQRLRNLVEQAEKARVSRIRGRTGASSNLSRHRRLTNSGRPTTSIGGVLERSLAVKIINSQGIVVGEMRGAAIYDLRGQKLYALKGVNIYRLTGELVGHLPPTLGSEKRLDRSADRLFPETSGAARRSKQTFG